MDLRSLIDVAMPPPKIDEKIAIDVPVESLWAWFVEEKRFLRWNRDAISLRWEGEGRVGELRQRRILGGVLSMRVTLESEWARGTGEGACWYFRARQTGPVMLLRDSTFSYGLRTTGRGTILSLEGSFLPQPFPIRRLYGAVATDWIMAGAFRLKELAESTTAP